MEGVSLHSWLFCFVVAIVISGRYLAVKDADEIALKANIISEEDFIWYRQLHTVFINLSL